MNQPQQQSAFECEDLRCLLPFPHVHVWNRTTGAPMVLAISPQELAARILEQHWTIQDQDRCRRVGQLLIDLFRVENGHPGEG